MDDDAWEVSGCTERFTSVPGLALCRLSVTPGNAPVTVLEALEMEMPFTLSKASTPLSAGVKPKLPPEALAVKLPALPELLLVIARREPLASVMILAVTPSLSPLMAFFRSVRVLTPLPVVIVVDDPPAGVMVMVSAGKSVVEVATAEEE